MLVNGYRRAEIILGYLGAYTILATIQTLIVLFELAWVFNLDYDIGKQLSIGSRLKHHEGVRDQRTDPQLCWNRQTAVRMVTGSPCLLATRIAM